MTMTEERRPPGPPDLPKCKHCETTVFNGRCSCKPGEGRYAPTELCRPLAGDLVLVQGTAWTSRRIAAGQRRHDPKWCWATHCGIMVTETLMVEALVHGVELSPLAKYDHIKHAVVPVSYSGPAVRERAVDFANHAIGRQYGLLEDASLAVYCYSGSRLRVALDNQLICSALAAEALSREFIFPFEPLFAMPAHLTKFFGVTEP